MPVDMNRHSCHNCAMSAPMVEVCPNCRFAQYCSHACAVEHRSQHNHSSQCGTLAALAINHVAHVIRRYADLLAIRIEHDGRCDVEYVRKTWNRYHAGSGLLLFKKVRAGDAPSCAGQPDYLGAQDVVVEVGTGSVVWLVHDPAVLSPTTHLFPNVNEGVLGSGTVIDTASPLLTGRDFTQSVKSITEMYGFTFERVGAVTTTTDARDAFHAPGHLIIVFEVCVLTAPALGLYRCGDTFVCIDYNTRTQRVRLIGKMGIQILT